MKTLDIPTDQNWMQEWWTLCNTVHSITLNYSLEISGYEEKSKVSIIVEIALASEKKKWRMFHTWPADSKINQELHLYGLLFQISET